MHGADFTGFRQPGPAQKTRTNLRYLQERVSVYFRLYGFRTPAHHECRALGAGVRKPPKNETAGEGTRTEPSLAELWGFEDRAGCHEVGADAEGTRAPQRG
jgi:hypothetical protein